MDKREALSGLSAAASEYRAIALEISRVVGEVEAIEEAHLRLGHELCELQARKGEAMSRLKQEAMKG